MMEEEKEERKGSDFDQDDDDHDDLGDVDDIDGPSQAKKLLAFYSWTCPNCNFANAKNTLPKYRCYCGKY